MSVIYGDNEEANNSPSAGRRYLRAKRQREHAGNSNHSKQQFRLSGKDAINIETKTLTKRIAITWSISKQTIDVAKLSSKGEKKGVIETSVKYHDHTFNLELCVPGWRRSQDGFSAFYLTVPRKTKLEKQRIRMKMQRVRQSQLLNADDDDDDRVRDDDDGGQVHVDEQDGHGPQQHANRSVRPYILSDRDAELNVNSNVSNNNSNVNTHSNLAAASSNDEDDDNDFVARYSVSFGDTEHRVTRKSSIRNDFDLGVGFPNFTEVSTLMDSIYSNSLDFLIEVEIFECESTIRDRPFMHQRSGNAYKNISSQLVEKMYYERLHCDAVIVAHYLNKHNVNKAAHLRVHKCILTAASPVFHSCFKHESKENLTSSIVMNQWNVNTIMTMIKFLYLGKIQLFHAELDRLDEDENTQHGNDGDEDDDKQVNGHGNDSDADLQGLDIDDDDDDDHEAVDSESEAVHTHMDIDKDNEQDLVVNNQADNSRSALAMESEFERKEEETLQDDADHDNDNNSNNNNNNSRLNGSGLYEEVKCAEVEEANATNSSLSSSQKLRAELKGACNARDLELASLESQCPETARRLFALFQIAECYEIHDLSIACCYKLVSNIATHTCCIFLIYLDKYTHLDAKMREIKNYILDYIVSNIHTVKKTNGYLYLLKNKPDLLGELIVKITENVRN